MPLEQELEGKMSGQKLAREECEPSIDMENEITVSAKFVKDIN